MKKILSKTKKTNNNNNKEKGDKKSFDFILLSIVLILLSIGLTMVLSASSPSAVRDTGNAYYYAEKQLMAALIRNAIYVYVI